MKTIVLIIVCFPFINQPTVAQVFEREVSGSCGATQQNETIILTSTAGQPVIATIANAEVTLTQGFQQADLPTQKGNNSGFENLEISIFPNPTSRHLSVVIRQEEKRATHIRIFNILGNEIDRKPVNGEPGMEVKTDFSLENLPDGVYLVVITNIDGVPIHSQKFTRVH